MHAATGAMQRPHGAERGFLAVGPNERQSLDVGVPSLDGALGSNIKKNKRVFLGVPYLETIPYMASRKGRPMRCGNASNVGDVVNRISSMPCLAVCKSGSPSLDGSGNTSQLLPQQVGGKLRTPQIVGFMLVLF